MEELLKVAEYEPGKEQLVFVGDMVDRGPDPVGVVRRVQELKAWAAMGNHEEKHLRFKRHRLRALADNRYKNPMKPMDEERLKQHLAFTLEDWKFIENLEPYVVLNQDWVVVHAGLEPDVHIEDQDENALLRLRFVKTDTRKMAKKGDVVTPDGLNKPEGTEHWTKFWTGPQNIIYGHYVYPNEPNVQTNDTPNGGKVVCVGIDTGCCFGYRLTAVRLDVTDPWARMTHFSVKAKQAYAKYKGYLWDDPDACV